MNNNFLCPGKFVVIPGAIFFFHQAESHLCFPVFPHQESKSGSGASESVAFDK